MDGITALEKAEWLLGFDFDGTLADVENDHTVSPVFFQTLAKVQSRLPVAWGIATGRSLEFLMEGMEKAGFPVLPDYVITQERDLFYFTEHGEVLPDERNEEAGQALTATLSENTETLKEIERHIREHTTADWVSIPEDPAGIIASHEGQIQEAVDLFHASETRTPELDYQRNTIYLRFTHKGYCKGTAMTYLREKFIISHQKTLVMGDNYNDLTMLNEKVAAHYGGPENSITELKDALRETGGFITENPHALGVSEALKELILKQA